MKALTRSQTVLNCVQTIYLFTSAYPAVLSGSNAATLLPYLKNATTVILLLRIVRVRSAYHAFVGGGADDFRLHTAHLPSFYPTHAQDCRQVWTRVTTSSSTYDIEAIDRCRRSGTTHVILLALCVDFENMQGLQETVACICATVHHLTHDFGRLVALLRSCNGV